VLRSQPIRLKKKKLSPRLNKLSNVEGFDERHGAEAVDFYKFLDAAGAFDMTDPAQREMAAKVSAFAAITTDERPHIIAVTDENVAAAGTIVEKIVPPSI
jgi:hypothetical protein